MINIVFFTTPNYLEHPKTRVKTAKGYRTVAALGVWYDYIFSEEMYNAMKFGYKFENLKGFLFDNIIFEKFVDNLYSLKQTHTKEDPMYLISKLLMNSLYGKFGMTETLPTHNVMSKDEFFKFVDTHKYIINDHTEYGDKFLVSYFEKSKNLSNIINSDNAILNISIAIAAAITAIARIEMSQFKNNSNLKLLYTDTDSIVIDGELNEEFISSSILG